MSKNKSSPKFAFLLDDSPFHAYYLAKIEECKKSLPASAPVATAAVSSSSSSSSATSAVVVKPEQPSAASAASTTSTSAPPDESTSQKRQANSALFTFQHSIAEQLDQLKKPKPPIPTERWLDKFSVRPPPGTAAQDVDIIKLTAQFVARNGREFLMGLVSREHNNPQFAFLRANHPLFSYFQLLLEAYAAILTPDPALLDELRADVQNSQRVLQRALGRLEFDRLEKKMLAARDADEEAERVAMALIDWHDFVVVKTIDFTNEEVGVIDSN